MDKIPVIAIVGPTASGKTKLSLELGKKYNAEIVSADSMQIYKTLDIGTAKPTKYELSQIKHHMIDVIEPYEKFSVKQYCDMAHKIVKDIHYRGKLPFLVGGTGLYVDSLLSNTLFADMETDFALREHLNERAKAEGVDILLDELSEFDKLSADFLAKEKNPKRIVRAIEIYKTTGITLSEHKKNSHREESAYLPIYIRLDFKSRQNLYDRVNSRVDLMLADGLLEEAKRVYRMPNDTTAKSAIGYKEFFPFFEDRESLKICTDNLKTASRHYAKRQITWFKKNPEMNGIFVDEGADCFDNLVKTCTDKIDLFLQR